jgi:hypothetical protein
MRWSAYPLSEISGICKRYTAGDDTRFDLGLCRDIASPRNDYFVRRTYFPANELNLIGNKQGNRLHVLPLAPSA